MTISIAIERAARRSGNTLQNRRVQFLNELRMDEQSLVAEAVDQVDEYRRHDNDSDIAFIQAIKALYANLTDQDAMRRCERVYTVWKTTEDRDERIIDRLDQKLGQTRVVMHRNNDHLLNGAWTPATADVVA